MASPKTIKGWVRELDRVVREHFQRKHDWTCVRCGKRDTNPKRMNWAHIEGRGKKETRWDLDNALLLCVGCHFWLDNTDNRLEANRWLEEKIGKKKLADLRKRAQRTRQWVLADYAPYYKTKVEEIGAKWKLE